MLQNFVLALMGLLLLGAEVMGYQIMDAPLLTKRPPWLKVCRRNDPEVNRCLNDLFIDLFPQLAVGIPELNVGRFEPLKLDKVSVSKGSGPVTLSGNLYDLTVKGSSNATPTHTEFDHKNKIWNFGVDVPLLDIKSFYNLKGKILVLPLVGHGRCDLRLANVRTEVTTYTDFPLIEGREIVKIVHMNVSFTLSHMRVKLHNLFNGNKVLGQTVNAFVNQHGLEIVDDLRESLGKSLAVIFTDIVNNVFTKIPTDLWFLTDEQWDEYQKTLKKEST